MFVEPEMGSKGDAGCISFQASFHWAFISFRKPFSSFAIFPLSPFISYYRTVGDSLEAVIFFLQFLIPVFLFLNGF